MSKSIRLATIALLGSLLAPSLCSAQLIIFHENWHGFGSKKVERPVSTKPRHQRPKSAYQPVHESAYQPVRVAEHQFQSSEVGESVVQELPDHVMQTIPYDVIASPLRQPHREETLHFRSKHHPPIIYREGPQTERAVVLGANQVPVWKTPFSYGYFGTNGTKHWYSHYGYRDRRTVWSYR